MSDLSKEQLELLTDAISDRLAEFELPSAKMPTKGVIRVAYEVISVFVRGQMTPCREEAADERVVVEKPLNIKPIPSNPVPLSDSAVATLGPEHTIVTPLKAAGKTLEEADTDQFAELNLNSELKAKMLRDIIGELRMMSKRGEMPTMADWDARKPMHMPKAIAAVHRYNLTWGRLAEYANLIYEGRRPTPKVA